MWPGCGPWPSRPGGVTCGPASLCARTAYDSSRSVVPERRTVAETKFGFNLVGIASALTSRRLAVPIYQRSYAWGSDDPKERDQVTEYWNDLRSTFSEPGEEYFLGTIVLSREGADDRVAIIDGQQRLATTAILLSVIRDVFRERGDDYRADLIEDDLSKGDMESGIEVAQLKLNAEDDPFFYKFVILGDHAAQPTQESHALIRRAYEVLKDSVTATADDAGNNWNSRLRDWVKFLKDRARVIVVEVPTEADAFLIFETLNDRGADLTIADLLKNYLFRRAEKDLDTVRNAWVSALANLDIANTGSELFTDFLRHYWSSKYGATRERELYARIKEKISTGANALEFALELQESSRLYAAILHSDHEYWSEYDTSMRNNVEVLTTLKLEQNRPLLLAAMQYLTKSELRKTLRGLVSWSVRSLVVGGIGGGTAERIYCEAAMKIRSGSAKSASDIAAELKMLIHSDAQFGDSFDNVRITRGPLARYMLVALERTAKGTSEPELVPNDNEAEVNLEHILPRNPAIGDWPQFTPDERRAYLHRLGNMVLLSRGPNGKIGNAPFSVKRPILQASELELTQEAGGESVWTPTVIASRQRRLTELAVRTWKANP
jgi:hypothetical protein